MRTLYGQEAREGDFVLVQDVQYMSGSADILVAKVKGNKAYAASAVACRQGRRWLRKETAIIKVDEAYVTEFEKQLIDMNIASIKSTFALGTDYTREVFLLQDAAVKKRNTQEV